MKLVLVTGASSGIGEAAARLFAQEGHKVLLLARRKDKLDALVAEIGANAVALACDASDSDAVQAMADVAIDAHGVPDIIIHSAGAGEWKQLQDTSMEEAKAMIGAPYLASLFVTRAFLPGMLKRNSGVVIHIGSPAAFVAWPSSVGYTASRAALHGFHEALSQDLVKTGVKSCHVIFGRIASPYFETNTVPETAVPSLSKTMPTLTSEQCAKVLLKIAKNPKRDVAYPAMLSFLIWFNRFFPSVCRWMVRF